MNKQRIIIFVLLFVLASSTFGYAISSYMMNKNVNPNTGDVTQEEIEKSLGYVQNLQNALNQAVIDKNFVKQSSIDDLIKRNDAGDYTLSATLNILGTPVCVLESIDSYAITSYTNEYDITDFLANINDEKKYKENSFIQLYWMKETGEAIITWISLDDLSEIKIIGLIASQYQDLNDIKVKEVTNDEEVINDVGITKEEMLKKYNPMEYKTQYKLLECKFVTNLMKDEYTSVWSEYVLKNKYGYLHLNTKDDSYYMAYQSFTNFEEIPIYTEEQRTEVIEEMELSKFNEMFPDAILYRKEESDGHVYVSYVIRNSESLDDLYYFDFTDGKLVSKP